LVTTRKIKGYGWTPDLPDFRDHTFKIQKLAAVVPPKLDLSDGFKHPPFDQGELGSCTGNAIAGLIDFDLKKEHKRDFIPSRLFIYYNERDIEGTTNEDAGAMIRDGIKSVAKQGDCPESIWPYKIAKFTKKPSKSAYTAALKHEAVQYERLVRTGNADADVYMMKNCIASGFPFVFGFTVYDSFESPEVEKTGTVPMPDPNTENELGGHACIVVGYDDEQGRFKIRNSWGSEWGDHGYFTLPYEYLLNENLSDDFWKITIIG